MIGDEPVKEHMNEQQFQESLNQRVSQLQSAGEPADKIQEWIDSQWAQYDSNNQTKEDPTQDPSSQTIDTDQIDNTTDQVQDDPEASQAVQEDQEVPTQSIPNTIVESQTIQEWNQAKFRGDDRKAYNHWKETGEYDSELLGLETQAKIEAERSKKEEYVRQEGETEEDYYLRIGEMQRQEDLGDSSVTNNMVTRAFWNLFKTAHLGGMAGNDSAIQKYNERITELKDNKDSMDPEEYERELEKATSLKNASEYLSWEGWEQGKQHVQGQAAGKKELNLADADGNIDWLAVKDGLGDGSLFTEVVNQLPNTIIAGIGKTPIAQIPGVLFFGAQMMNEYRQGVINEVLDKQHGQGKWGKKEYLAYIRSDEGKAAINEAKLYGFGAGQIDRLVDRITLKGAGTAGKLAGKVPGAQTLSGIITNKAAKAVMKGVARFGFEVETEKLTEHLQEELGGSVAARASGELKGNAAVNALDRVANWYGSKDLYSDEEIREVGNLRALTGITAGVLSGPGSVVQTASEINKGRKVDGKPINTQRLRRDVHNQANQQDLANARAMAQEYTDQGKPVPPPVQKSIQNLVDKVEQRNVNNEKILGEQSNENISKLTELDQEKAGWQAVLEDPNSSEAIKNQAVVEISKLDNEAGNTYYAPLERDEQRRAFKEENVDEFAKLDEINRKLRDPNLSEEQVRDLQAQLNQYQTEIRNKQQVIQGTVPGSVQNNLENVQNITDRRMNPRKKDEPRFQFKSRVRDEVNTELGIAFGKKNLSTVQKERLTKQLIKNNEAWIQEKVNKFRRSWGSRTNKETTYNWQDFEASLRRQMVANALGYDPKKSKGKFSTHVFAHAESHAWNRFRDETGVIRTTDDSIIIGKTYDVKPSEGKSVEESLEGSSEEVQGQDTGSYDPSQSYEIDKVTDQSQAILNHVHKLSPELVEGIDQGIIDNIEKGLVIQHAKSANKEGVVGDQLSDQRQRASEAKWYTKLLKGDSKAGYAAVRGPIRKHFDQLWGKKPADQLQFLADNWDVLQHGLPSTARNGKFLDGLLNTDYLSFEELEAYMTKDSAKNNQRNLRRLQDAFIERMVQVAVERVSANNPDIKLYADPSFQLDNETYIKQRELRDRTIVGLSDRLRAAWAGTGVTIIDSPAGFAHYAEIYGAPSNTAGFAIGDHTIVLNPNRALGDTELHEFSHIWFKGMKNFDPKRYQQGVNLIKNSPYLQEIINSESYQEQYGPYEGNEDIYHEEALATALGREGAELFDTLNQQKAWDKWVDTFKKIFKRLFGTSFDPKMKLDEFLKNAAVDVIQGDAIIRNLKKGKEKQAAFQFEGSERANRLNRLLEAKENLGDRYKGQHDAEIARLEGQKAKSEEAKIEEGPQMSDYERELRAKFPNHPESLIKNLVRTHERKAGLTDSNTLTANKGITPDAIAAEEEATKRRLDARRNSGAGNLTYKQALEKSNLVKQREAVKEVIERNPEVLEKGKGYAKLPQAERDYLEALPFVNPATIFASFGDMKNEINNRELVAQQKVEIFETRKALKQAFKTGGETDVLLDKLKQLGKDPQVEAQKIVHQRLIDFVKHPDNRGSFPPTLVKLLDKQLKAYDAKRIRVGDKKIDLTSEGDWNSDSSRRDNMIDILTEMRDWPRILQVEIAQQLQRSSPNVINSATQVLHSVKNWKGVINGLTKDGSINATQQAQLLQMIDENTDKMKSDLKNETEGIKNAPGLKIGADKGFSAVFMSVLDTIAESNGNDVRPLDGAIDAIIARGGTEIMTTHKKKTPDNKVQTPENYPTLKSGEPSPTTVNTRQKWIDAAKDKQQLLKDILGKLTDAVHNNRMSQQAAWRLWYTLFNEQSGLGRTSATREYYDANIVGGAPTTENYTVEHMLPTHAVKTTLFAAGMAGRNVDNIFKNFVMMDLGRLDDEALTSIGLQSATVQEIFDENWDMLGTIPGTTVPMSVLRYLNSGIFINPFRLKRYDTLGKTSLGHELGIPTEFQEVMDKIDKGETANRNGIAFQIIENASDRKVLKAKEIAKRQKQALTEKQALQEEDYIPVTLKTQEERSGKSRQGGKRVSGFITDQEFDDQLAQTYEEYKAAQERIYKEQYGKDVAEYTGDQEAFTDEDFAQTEQTIKVSPSKLYSQDVDIFRMQDDEAKLASINAGLTNEADRRNIGYQIDGETGNLSNQINDVINKIANAKAPGKGNTTGKSKLAAYAKYLQANASNITHREIAQIASEVEQILNTGTSDVIKRVKEYQNRKKAMANSGNEQISKVTGIEENVSNNEAERLGTDKKRWYEKLNSLNPTRLLAPRSNNDFFGLLYDLLPSHGKDREAAKNWQKENLIDPLNKANFDYLEKQHAMRNNATNGLIEFANKTGISGRNDASKAANAKAELNKQSGIETEKAGPLTKNQVIRIFNHLKDPNLHAQIKEALSEAEINKIIDYMTKGNPDLLALSQTLLDNYTAAGVEIQSAMSSRGYKGLSKYAITPGQKQDPILKRVYGGKVPNYAPYSPMSATSTQDEDFINKFSGADFDPYSVMSGRLANERKGGGEYQVVGRDAFSDLESYIGAGGPLRTVAFLDFAQNMSGFLSKDNLNKAKISTKLGDTWANSMQDSMRRIFTGRNRPSKLGKTEQRVYDWMNGSVAAIMFLNMRSAGLQLLSTFNYLAQDPITTMKGAGAALANPAMIKRTAKAMASSAWFAERGKGATQLELEEIFSLQPTTAFGKFQKWFARNGYSATKAGDKAAIFMGGLPFVAGKIAHYEKQGMTAKEAENQAIQDFIASAEEAQQSSRAERLGQEQTGTLGRMFLAFANTPQQYNRLMSRSIQDAYAAVKDGRFLGDNGILHNASKVAYFGMVQNMIFTLAQQAILNAMWEPEELSDEEEEKYNLVANSMADTVLRGSGIYGAIVSTLKNIAIKGIQKGKFDKADVFQNILNTAPAIGSKAGHVNKVLKERIHGLSEEPLNAEWYRLASAINVATNIPADRILKKFEALQDMAASDLDNLTKALRFWGWDRYTLGEETTRTEHGEIAEDLLYGAQDIIDDNFR